VEEFIMEKKRPGRPPKSAEWFMLTLRLEPEIVETLDRLVERRYQQEGLNVTRVDLIRQAVRQYIERETAEVH
jgi:predicted transcriptional regulator